MIVLLAVPCVLAFAGTALLLRREPLYVALGAALVLMAGLVPLLFAYTFVLAIAFGVAGAVAVVATRWRRIEGLGWALATVAIVVLVGEPVIALNVAQVQADENYSRCAGDMAVAAIAKSVAAGRGYPADIGEVASNDGEYGVGACYVSNNVNWLYRVAAPGTYTIGYWVDWHFTRHVCLRSARTQGWTCGFEAWGPFKPGEVD